VFQRFRDKTHTRNRNDHSLDKKADVYAFGVVLWEMLHRERPWNDLEFEEIEKRVTNQVSLQVKPEVIASPNSLTKLMVRFIRQCTQSGAYSFPF
jgi:hypothetical protein